MPIVGWKINHGNWHVFQREVTENSAGSDPPYPPDLSFRGRMEAMISNRCTIRQDLHLKASLIQILSN